MSCKKEPYRCCVCVVESPFEWEDDEEEAAGAEYDGAGEEYDGAGEE